MANKTPFPVELVNRTPATVRRAFWESPTLKKELSSSPGQMNVTSILTAAMQIAGRFAERYVSDLLYELDRIRTLVGDGYVLDRDFDEIIVMAVRKDGVDGESFFLSRLEKTLHPMGFQAKPWEMYTSPETIYRRVLGCRVWAESPRYGSPGRMGCELRDLTNSLLRMNQADFDDDGKLLMPPYDGGNPVPIDFYTKAPATEPDDSKYRDENGRKSCYMDVTRKDDGAVLSCAACGHTFDLGYAADPAKELSRIALGAYLYCPRCGAAYEGCRIDGVPFEECGQEVRSLLSDGGLAPVPSEKDELKGDHTMDKNKTVKNRAGDEMTLCKMEVAGFSCNRCGSDVKPGDFAFICPDCGAVLCENCAAEERHECDPDEDME